MKGKKVTKQRRRTMRRKEAQASRRLEEAKALKRQRGRLSFRESTDVGAAMVALLGGAVLDRRLR